MPFKTWTNLVRTASAHMHAVNGAQRCSSLIQRIQVSDGVDSKLSTVSKIMTKQNRAIVTSIVITDNSYVLYKAKSSFVGRHAEEGIF